MPTERYIATCPQQAREPLAKELQRLGLRGLELGFRCVYFDADAEEALKVHLRLSGASRIHRLIKTFSAKSPQMLFSQAKRIRWDQIFPERTTFLVEGITGNRGDEFMSSNTISKKVREGIQDYFAYRGLRAPEVDLKDPKVKIVAFVRNHRCYLSVDTSGQSLHKRGYRLEGHPAPIKETLAATILELAEYDGERPFFDPMCGSGTIAIEACYRALNKAPLIHRSQGKFGFENLEDFDRGLWRRICDQTRLARRDHPEHPIFANDINAEFIAAAKANAKRARVGQHIKFDTRDFFSAPPPCLGGLMITNLPYGERLSQEDEDPKVFYKKIGDTLKQNYKGWRVGLLAPLESPYKFIGLKPDKKIDLVNGSIPVKLVFYDIF